LKDLTLKELTLTVRGTATLFDQLVGPWNADIMMVELAAEVGTLADSIMIREGHRPPRSSLDDIDLEDDVADVLFMLVRIADHYNIDLDNAYERMICGTRRKLEKLMEEQQTSLDS
jgi:NTP pyrophosphatase (non-canonical NTP hydrolase)